MKFGFNTWIDVVINSFEKEVRTLSLKGSFTPKPAFWGVFQSVSCYQPTDKWSFLVEMTIQSYILNAKDVPLLGDFFVHKLPFWEYFALKVPKIDSTRLCCFAPLPTCNMHYAGCIKSGSTLQQLATVSEISGCRSVSADPRTSCGSYFAAGFCIHCCRHKDDCNFYRSVACNAATTEWTVQGIQWSCFYFQSLNNIIAKFFIFLKYFFLSLPLREIWLSFKMA